VPYLSASAVVIHYEEALYQVYGPLPYLLPLPRNGQKAIDCCCRSAGSRILVKDLQPNTTYRLRINAKNEVGFGNYVQLSVTTKSLSEYNLRTLNRF